MEFWDLDRQLQRYLEHTFQVEAQARQEALRFQEEIRLREQSPRGFESFRLVKEHLGFLAHEQDLLQRQPALLMTEQLLLASIQPLPDIGLRGMEMAEAAASFARLNAGIANSRFLAELDISDSAVDGDEAPASGSQTIPNQIDAGLIQIAPADSLRALRKVRFAPIILLDRVLRNPERMFRMQPREFEEFIALLLQNLGFENVKLTPPTHDHGRDILATKHVHGIPIIFAFECKRYSTNRAVGVDVARALLGTIMHEDTRAVKGVLVTTAHFTSGARKFILSEPCLDGKDFDGIVRWLQEYGTKKRSS